MKLLYHKPMEFCFSLFLLLTSIPVILAQEQGVAHVNIVIDGTSAIGKVDSNYICATIDWWPHDKCNYNQCPWGYTSAMNLVRLGKFSSVFFFCSNNLKSSLDCYLMWFLFSRTWLILYLPRQSKVCLHE